MDGYLSIGRLTAEGGGGREGAGGGGGVVLYGREGRVAAKLQAMTAVGGPAGSSRTRRGTRDGRSCVELCRDCLPLVCEKRAAMTSSRPTAACACDLHRLPSRDAASSSVLTMIGTRPRLKLGIQEPDRRGARREEGKRDKPFSCRGLKCRE